MAKMAQKRSICSRVRDNDPTLKVFLIDANFFMLHQWEKDENELAELGVAISLNTRLERLVIGDMHRPHIHVPWEIAQGVERNSSISDLRLRWTMEEHGHVLDVMRAFRDKGNLRKISLEGCHLGTGEINLLASTINRCKRLNYISVTQCGIDDAQLGAIVRACRDHVELKVLELSGNYYIGRGGCEALASLLQRPTCNIVTLCLDRTSIDDACVAVIADSLTRNKTLTKLYLESFRGITRAGWFQLGRALCDTTTINAIYSSNHTLRSIGQKYNYRMSYPINGVLGPMPLFSYLALNHTENKRQVAMNKILIHLRRLDMEPFFELELKLLPLVVNWFDGAEESTMLDSDNSIQRLRARKLDAIFQFTKSMPMMSAKTPPSKRHSLTFTTYLSICVAIISAVLYVAAEFVKEKWT